MSYRGDNMFGQFKLNKYKKYIVGFAYDYFLADFGYAGMRTYIVIYKDDVYSFVKFRTFYAENVSQFKFIIEQGYQPLSYWAKLNEKNDKTKNLAK